MSIRARCLGSLAIVTLIWVRQVECQAPASETGFLAQHVLRVQCDPGAQLGSGFVHRSGLAITAAHVVARCRASDLRLVSSQGAAISVRTMKVDNDLDLALLTPQQPFAAGLTINPSETLMVGATLAIWGFPAGYDGRVPLLTVGYLSGVGSVAEPKLRRRLFVNAAFNSGNSGGPVIDAASKAVVGVVNAKLAPIPAEIEAALGALERQAAGRTYTVTRPDGSTFQLTEAQLVARILHYLRSQTQLVLGTAVTSTDVVDFLRKNGVEP